MDEGQDNYVGLNVGGKIFKTSRTTLLAKPESFFSGLLGGSISSARDDQGNYLIDQDGKVFRHVLNFMRYNELVLPEGFKEYGVLNRQADFFQLESLYFSIKRLMEVGGTEAVELECAGKKVFHTTREILMRERNTYFTWMLSKESTVESYQRGNYFLRDISNNELLQHALSYLTHGGILDPVIDRDILSYLDSNNERIRNPFKLNGFDNHCDLIRNAPPNNLRDQGPTRLHFYYNLNTPCFAYILRPERMDATCSSSTVSMLRDRLFLKRTRIVGNIDAGVVNMDYINSKLPASLYDVMAYFKADERAEIKTYIISPTCIRLNVIYKSMYGYN